MSKRFLLYWLLLILWISAIFVVSSLPGNSFPMREFGIPTKYPLHITTFFCLFVLFYRMLNVREKRMSLTTILLSSFMKIPQNTPPFMAGMNAARG